MDYSKERYAGNGAVAASNRTGVVQSVFWNVAMAA